MDCGFARPSGEKKPAIPHMGLGSSIALSCIRFAHSPIFTSILTTSQRMNLLDWCKSRLRNTWLFQKAAPLTIYARNKWFDLRHSVNTAASVPLSQVTVHGPNRNQGVIYSTVSDSMLRGLLDRLPIRHELFTFVDFG